MTAFRPEVVAPLTAAALIAQQVASNAIRDGLVLTSFSVQSLPYFMAAAAALAIVATQLSGSLLARLGPARIVPALFAASAALFLIERLLLGWRPSIAAVLLYLHSTVLGAIAISSFWSLLNERFDPHSAKALMARVAGAATVGGLIGGVTAERVAALLSPGALLPLLALAAGICVAGTFGLGIGVRAGQARAAGDAGLEGGWTNVRRQPLLRSLGLVVVLAATLAALVDYLLKAEAVSYFGKGEPLVRFFGLFYAGTALTSVLLQASLGRVALTRLGLGGSVASHPAVVGVAALLGFVLPPPLRGILPRSLDVVVRSSIFRTGYELLYTPIAEGAKRSAKSVIDVALDCAGKGAGALLILALAAAVPSHPFLAVNVAAALLAAGELVVARRLRTDYIGALEGGLRRQGGDLPEAAVNSMADFTIARSMAGLDRAAVMKALGAPAAVPAGPVLDPVVAAIADLRSGDIGRMRAALARPPADPILIGAVVPLLANDQVARLAIAALGRFGVRAAGEMVSVLLDPSTPDAIRRRLPLVLKTCPSPLARDGLLAALRGDGFQCRLRSGRAVLALTAEHPDLVKPDPAALELVERELSGAAAPHLVREHVFNLLALALDRQPMSIAARAFDTDDPYLKGTALEYLETVLPPRLFSSLQPLLAAPAPLPGRRPAAEARAELIRAGTTMTVSLDEVRRRLEASARDDI